MSSIFFCCINTILLDIWYKICYNTGIGYRLSNNKITKERDHKLAYLRKSANIPSSGKGARLSPKMRLFIDEFFIDFNATSAVLRAGYKTGNPAQLAAELRNHPLVNSEIERRQDVLSDKKEIERDYLLNKLVDVIESGEERTSDKLRAIELAGKAIALWRDRQEISGPDGEAIRTEQKTEQNVADFKSKLAILAKRAGTENVIEFPNSDGDGKA